MHNVLFWQAIVKKTVNIDFQHYNDMLYSDKLQSKKI